MRKILFGVMILLVWAQGAFSEQFLLKSDGSDKQYGPFEYKQDATIIVGKASFTLLKAEGKTGPTLELKSDVSDKVYGPFEYKQGTKITVGKTSFTLLKVGGKLAPRHVKIQPTLHQKLVYTVIPEIDFKQANLKDVLDFLREAGEAYCPWQDAKNKGVNIILNMKDEELRKVPLITFTGQKLSLIDCIKAVTSVADLEYEVRRNWVMIRAKQPKKKGK